MFLRFSEAKFFFSCMLLGIIKGINTLGYLHYELSTDVKWSLIFELMENNKQILQLEDYAVNQTSLEQVCWRVKLG